MNDAAGVQNNHILHASSDQHLCAGDAGCACAGDDYAKVLQATAQQRTGITEGGGGYHGSAVLIIMHNGNVQVILQPLLQLKAPRRGNILQVDCAERGCDAADGVKHFVHIGGVQDDRDTVETNEALEQLGLTFHHGQCRLWADVAQAQHSSPVRNDGHVAPCPRVVVCEGRVLMNGLAHARHTGSVGDGQVADGFQVQPRGCCDFSTLVGVENFGIGEVSELV